MALLLTGTTLGLRSGREITIYLENDGRLEHQFLDAGKAGAFAKGESKT